jgi:hypothetical protein
MHDIGQFLDVLTSEDMKQICLSILLTLILASTSYTQSLHLVNPTATSSLITSPTNNHYIYYNSSVANKNKLFLFFPGTGAVPYNYTLILKEAANIGYHSIGLTYPNSVAINSICSSTLDTTCHSSARYEVFDGIDRTTSFIVDTNNCIQKRVIKLLQYLQLQYPTENWGQYYVGNTIVWDKIIVSGHSQGGGHAGFIGKIKQVERVVMFNAIDWINLLSRNADWITWNGATTENRYYGFGHQRDEYVNFTLLQTTWQKYGMLNYGTLILSDSTTTPYANSHTLYSNLLPANDTTQFHGLIADAYTPLDGSGNPILTPVWDYLIDSPLSMGITKYNNLPYNFSVSPNPSNNILNLKFENIETTLVHLKFSDCTRQILFNEFIDTNNEIHQIDISALQSGVYFLSLNNCTKKIIKN